MDKRKREGHDLVERWPFASQAVDQPEHATRTMIDEGKTKKPTAHAGLLSCKSSSPMHTLKECSLRLGTFASGQTLFTVPFESLAPMDTHPISLERAFQLARSGQSSSLEDIRLQLRREGLYEQVIGPVLTRQLRDLISDARPYERRGLRK